MGPYGLRHLLVSYFFRLLFFCLLFFCPIWADRKMEDRKMEDRKIGTQAIEYRGTAPLHSPAAAPSDAYQSSGAPPKVSSPSLCPVPRTRAEDKAAHRSLTANWRR